ILEATTDFVGMADLEGRVLYVNRAGRQMCGLPAEEELERSVASLHPSWAYERISHEGIPTALHAGVWSGETPVLDAQGQEAPVPQVSLAHRGPTGAVEFLSTICRDISESKRAETALRRAEESARAERDFSRQVLETTDALIIVLDPRGRIVRFNGKCAAVT